MGNFQGSNKPGYTVKLSVSKTTPAHTEKDGQYDTRSFSEETVELARFTFQGGELEPLLGTAKDIIDLVQEV